MESFQIVAWGLGVNSTAMIIGMLHKGESIQLISFADTGAERPETYAFKILFESWLRERAVNVITVKNDGMYDSLEDECLKKHTLPSLVMGFKSCSDKYKRRPQDKFVRHWAPALAYWAEGKKITKCIGIDVGELRRAKYNDDPKYTLRYPLIEWGWDRDDCVTAIQVAGLPVPPKSACFFCPATKKHEILDLAEKHPNLVQRAIVMEKNAELHTIKGLGRGYAWADFLRAQEAGRQRIPESMETPCDCYDGETDV